MKHLRLMYRIQYKQEPSANGQSHGIRSLSGDKIPPVKKKFCTNAVTRIRTWVVAATTRSTNHYTIMAVRRLNEMKMINEI